jgi:hypothetical protein
VRAVDAAEALAALTEISSQIETAAIADARDNVIAATPTDGVALAAAGRALLEQAGQARGREPAQLSASTDRGSVFVVRNRDRTIVVTTTPDPIAALVFYDLKNCLSNAS